eukprot:EG_transcript_11132
MALFTTNLPDYVDGIFQCDICYNPSSGIAGVYHCSCGWDCCRRCSGNKHCDRVNEIKEEADGSGDALLFEGARAGLLDVVEYVLESNVSLDVTNDQGETALEVSCQQQHWDVAHFLVSRGDTARRRTALFWLAARYGGADTMRRLLEGNAAVDQTNDSHATALGVAATHGHAGVVTVLLDAQADVQHVDGEGLTALRLAARKGHVEVARLLLQLPQKRNPISLITAAEGGDIEEVIRLLQAKAEVNHATGEDGSAPLHVACRQNRLEVTTVLVGAGAALDQTNNSGCTPLYTAAVNGHAEVLQLLVSAQASVDLADDDGCTPLWAACLGGHVEIARLLVGAGAALHLARDNGCAPLFVAAEGGHSEVVRLLVSAQADVNQSRKSGTTPLHIASCHGHVEAAQVLVSAQANVDLADD